MKTNRTIKFRAWHNTDKAMSEPFMLNDISFWEVTDYKSKMTFKLSQCGLMQYTGLKDKNGKEIYEGDVLEWTLIFKSDFGKEDSVSKTRYVVVYEMNNIMGIVGFYFKDTTGKYIHFHNFKDIEIIGNIYENPELCSTP